MNKTRFIQLLFALELCLASSAFAQSNNFNIAKATLNVVDAAHVRLKCPGDNNAKARFLITSGGNTGSFQWTLQKTDNSYALLKSGNLMQQTFTGLTAGSYILTVRNQGRNVGGVWVPGVTKTLNVTIQVAIAISAGTSATINNVSCRGGTVDLEDAFPEGTKVQKNPFPKGSLRGGAVKKLRVYSVCQLTTNSAKGIPSGPVY